MLTRLPPFRDFARGDGGFSLVEVMVAMLCGIVVTGALFAILEVSLRQTSRITDRVQATQIGRVSMTKMVNELHSACLSRKFAPVQDESTGSELRFVAGFGEEAVLEPAKVAEHRLVFSGSSTTLGTLIDKTYKAKTASQWPNFEFEPTAASSVLVGENISQISKAITVFQYFPYATAASSGTGEAAAGTLGGALSVGAKGLTEAQAKTVAAVQINFFQSPTNKNVALGRPAEFNTLVTFAFASPNSEATIVDGPCQ